ncbi:Putative sodium-dependent multivitamin transporter, partial [Araneus ventricosus]
MESKP